MARSESMKRLVELASRHDLKAFEDAWVEAIAAGPSDVQGLLDAISGLESQGQFHKAANYLQLLLPTCLDAKGRERDAVLVLKRLAKISPRDKNLRKNFVDVYRRLNAENAGFDRLVKHSQIETDMEVVKAVERLESYLAFRPGAYIEHPAGWGVGVVRSLNADEASVVIDFEEKKNHEIALEAACKITRHIDANHFRAMRFDRMDQITDMVENDPSRLVRIVVQSRDRQTTVRDLRDRLTDGIIPAKEWSKWWAKARAILKREPNVKIGTGSNPSVEITRTEVNFDDLVLANMRQIKTLPGKIKYMRELFDDLEAHPETRSALVIAAGVVAKIGGSDRAENPGPMMSLALMLERIRDLSDEYRIPEDLVVETFLTDPWKVLEALSSVPIAADRKEILVRLKSRFPADWSLLIEKAFYVGESDVCDFCIREMQDQDDWDRLNRVVDEVLNRFRDYRNSFLWYVRTVLKGGLPSILAKPTLASLLEKTILLHSHCTNLWLQNDDAEARKECRGIEKFLAARTTDLVARTIESCSLDASSNFYNMIRGSRSIPDDVKDQLVAIILRTRPEVAKVRADREEREALAAGAGLALVDESVLYVTSASFTRFESDYLRLVNDEIPRNAKEINRAASFGDLSENAEWSAAIEKQSMLTRREEEMREAIKKARVLDVATIRDETVSVGCRITVKNVSTDESETYTLLGPWDIDMDRRIISYLSPLGRTFLGKKVGEQAQIQVPSGSTTWRVEQIEVATELLAGSSSN